MNETEFVGRLAVLSHQIGIRIEEPELAKMFLHYNLLQKWSSRINLTGIDDPQQILIKHYIDSLTLADLPETKSHVMDIGSGAGFPGLPLGVIRRDLRLVLSEAATKKRIFLEKAQRVMGLPRVSIIGRSTDVEMDESLAEKFDMIVTRAFGDMVRILHTSTPFLKNGGKILAMKGPKVFQELLEQASEIETLGYTSEIVRETYLPELGQKRIIVAFQRMN